MIQVSGIPVTSLGGCEVTIEQVYLTIDSCANRKICPFLLL